MARTKETQAEKSDKVVVKFVRNHGAYTVDDIAAFESEVAERLKKINVAVDYETDGTGAKADGDANQSKDGAQ